MRKLFIVSTAIFWLAVAGFWLIDILRPTTPDAASKPAAEPALREYSLEEVRRHRLPDSCWMAIEGQVYDVSHYLPAHPSSPEIIKPWCGKEASHAWQTKTRSRPHSPYAENLLQQFQIGKLRRPP